MDYIDYYKILGVNKNATDADIKKAYRKLARKYHPDVNPNDESAKKQFQLVNEANEVLSNADNRKKYDQYGKDWKHADEIEKMRQQQGAGRGGYSYGGGGFDGFSGFGGGGDDYSDFFSSMFGGSGGMGGMGSGRTRSQSRYKGQDYSASLSLNLTDVAKTEKQVITIDGKKIRITIPAGVEDGQVIRLKGYGGEGVNGGPKGDLLITFQVINNTKYKREGSTLYASMDLDLYTAVLGGEAIVDTMDGKVKMKVAPGTQNGTKVKLKGKGFPIYKKEGQNGDLIVTWNIKIPTNLNAKQKSLFEELQKMQ